MNDRPADCTAVVGGVTERHRCDLPTGAYRFDSDTVLQCGCGQHWVRRYLMNCEPGFVWQAVSERKAKRLAKQSKRTERTRRAHGREMQ